MELEAAVSTWVDDALGEKRFEGGEIVSVADVGVYGVFKGLEITGGDFFEKHVGGNERMRRWYEEVEAVVGEIA